MNYVDHLLLSRFYQIAKISVLQFEVIMPKIKNKELQTIVSNQISNYDVLVKECQTLAKAHSIALPDHIFFKRCKQIIDENFDNITSVNTQTLIACTILSSLNTLIEIYNVESADSETINIGKHLQSMQDNNLQILREIKL
ncbi:MAG: hypothetical protein IJ358_02965 [Clostridia bacterium]|nr:hypothetical protein [Clostridia bacterium]